MRMRIKLRNEIPYGGRALIRDNWYTNRLVRNLRENEKLSAPQILQLQNNLLHKSLQRAIRTLPFYAHISSQFSPADAPRVLREQFPVIDKSSLLEHRDQLYPNHGHKKLWQPLGKTSGTTGTPLTIFRSAHSVLMEQSFIKRHWTWGNYHEGMARATLRGDLIVPLTQTEPPFWFWNRYNHQLLISSRHLSEQYADVIIEQIEKLQPYMLQAYPSTAYTLCQLLQRRNKVLPIPYLFSASEPLYRHQRELITDRLSCKIMDMYGMAERVAFATECEHGNMHINPDYSYVEILDEHDQPTDGEGYLVGTTFHNLAMPLVRYRLSDRSRWKVGQCACGRAFPMIEPVTGKYEDSIFAGKDEPISPSVLTFAFKGIDLIKKSQVAQIADAHWQIRIVPMDGFNEQSKQQLIHNIHTLVDETIQVDIVLMDDIANTQAGKFRWVVNETHQADHH